MICQRYPMHKIQRITRAWPLTHWGRVTHICVSRLTITGSDNGLSPGRRQAIIWTNAGILLIGPLGTNFSEILIEILTFSFKKMHLRVSSAKRRPFCLGLNGLKNIDHLYWEDTVSISRGIGTGDITVQFSAIYHNDVLSEKDCAIGSEILLNKMVYI